MIYTIAQEEKYIPEWNSNRDLHGADQGYVIINFPSVAEIAANAGDVENSLLFEFKNYIKSIHNFKVDEGGTIREMTVDDIINVPGLVPLFEELRKKYQSLTIVDKKK